MMKLLGGVFDLHLALPGASEVMLCKPNCDLGEGHSAKKEQGAVVSDQLSAACGLSGHLGLPC